MTFFSMAPELEIGSSTQVGLILPAEILRIRDSVLEGQNRNAGDHSKTGSHIAIYEDGRLMRRGKSPSQTLTLTTSVLTAIQSDPPSGAWSTWPKAMNPLVNDPRFLPRFDRAHPPAMPRRIAHFGKVFSLLLFLLSAAVSGGTRIVAVSGDPAPDGNGVFGNAGFVAAGLNDRGQTVFRAQLVGTADGFNDNSGLFLGDGRTLVQIARIGQAAPDRVSDGGIGSPDGRFRLLGPPALNASGEVAFVAALATSNGGNVTALYRGAGRPDSLIQIAREGESPTGGTGPFGLFPLTIPPTLNFQGQVGFGAQVNDALGGAQRYGAFLGTGTTMSQVSRFPVPITSGPVLNDAGTMAFVTGLQKDGTFAYAVTLGREGSTSLYALTGEPSPDGLGTFVLSSPLAPFLSPNGQMTFVAAINGTMGRYTAMYAVQDDHVTEVIRTGQPAPGLPEQTIQQFEWVFSNGAGEVVFTATTCCSAGIFRWSPLTMTVTNMILKDHPAPDGNGVIALLPAAAISPAEINAAGQIAFASQITGGTLFRDFGIFLVDGTRGLLQIARYGDSLLGSTITRLDLPTGASKANVAGGPAGRELSPLNNLGEVAYFFGLADGRSGIAIWNMDDLQITGISINPQSDVQISWRGTGGQTDVVQAASSISGTFTNISGNILLTGNGAISTNFVEHGGGGKGLSRFYRVQALP